MPSQHSLDILAKEFIICPNGTYVKGFNQGSDMTWHIFEKIISASLRKMNWMGVKAKLQVLRTSQILSEMAAERGGGLDEVLMKGGVMGMGFNWMCRLREMEESRWTYISLGQSSMTYNIYLVQLVQYKDI